MSFSHHVTNQPQATGNPELGSLDSKQSEKSFDDSLDDGGHHHHHQCEHGQQTSFSEHDNCHNFRLRRFLLPAILVFVALGGILAWSCMRGMPGWGADLMARALTDGSTSGESSFMKNKRQLAPLTHDFLLINYNLIILRALIVYLIVVFVGLFVVVILAIMLSAWCCKGQLFRGR